MNLFVCVLLSFVFLFVVVVTRPALFTTTLLCQHVQVTCCCHYNVTNNVDKLTYIFVRQDSLNPCGCFGLLGSAYTDCINQQAELHTTHTHTQVYLTLLNPAPPSSSAHLSIYQFGLPHTHPTTQSILVSPVCNDFYLPKLYYWAKLYFKSQRVRGRGRVME